MSDGLKLYAVRNAEGLWFHAVGIGGRGESWVPTLETARVYGRLGTARARVTWFANNHPGMKSPELVELRISETVVLDESKRVEKVKKTKEERRAEQAKRKAAFDLERAEEQCRLAEEELKRARKAAGKT